MLIKVFGAAVQGIDATLITIEVNSSRGCMFYLVGLPDSAVKESHKRIISALQVNGYRMPTSNIVINMAPVSYTHLDVYKRQVYLYIRILLTESGKVVFKSNTAINGRFAFTQQIYIGAVNNLYSCLLYTSFARSKE